VNDEAAHHGRPERTYLQHHRSATEGGAASVPALSIVLYLEGPIRVVSGAANEAEESRLRDWLMSNPERRELVQLACAMSRAA